MDFKDIKPGQILSGLTDENIEVVSVSFFGDHAAQIAYRKTDGSLSEQLLYSLDNIHEVEKKKELVFNTNGDVFKLVAEAKRIQQAYLFDPYFAVHSSAVEPLPHQISAVYEKMLNKHPLRYVLADDPGAGKTIMTGLLLKELIIRSDVKRALIVSPGNLVEQWQDELLQKFSLHFEIMTNEMIDSAASGNVFIEHDYLICRLDKLSRNEDLQQKLKAVEWDIVVIDEAHKLSATVSGNKVNYTKRYNLGKLLSGITRHFLLLTATPHNGNEADFQQFMSLIDPDRFQCHSENIKVKVDTSDVMRRLVKEELLKFDGTPLFPERIAKTITYTLSPEEQELYDDVTDYVREQFNRADRLKANKKLAVGFALTVLQRRLASSPEAIYQSLKRRKERLKSRYEDLLSNTKTYEDTALYSAFSEEDYEELPCEELDDYEDGMLDGATASATIDELNKEIIALTYLENKAEIIKRSNTDRKWEELSGLLQSSAMKDATGKMEKIIIFTEHKDTLKYLTNKIRTLIGRNEAVITIQGGMNRRDRKHAEQMFKQDKDVAILIATDAAGEGINLQRAHLMINYDLPWNPNRIEQRFGRIHRIGQLQPCHLWNMVADNTREGDVFSRLLGKLEQERESLGGKVFDILGKLTFNNKPLKDLLIEAIRYGNDPKNIAYIHTVIDSSLDRSHLVNLIKEKALSEDILDVGTVNRIKEDMERMNARRLQPYYIQSFFISAFHVAGGVIHKREKDRYEITRVPNKVINNYQSSEFSKTVLKRYERVCFEKNAITCEGKPDADLICPGHPLMDALIDWVLRTYGADYNKGTILVSNKLQQPHLICSIDTSIKDSVKKFDENRIISRRICFTEIDMDGNTNAAGYAPYLDFETLDSSKFNEVYAQLDSEGMFDKISKLKSKAMSYAVTSIIPNIVAEAVQERHRICDKIAGEVDMRLKSEIAYWDKKARQYKETLYKKGESQVVRNNMIYAEDKANELDERRKKRLNELNLEKNIVPLPPVLSSMALVIPTSYINEKIQNEQHLYGEERAVIEKIAMDKVMAIERSLGYVPYDVSKENRGYDIESYIPEEKRTGKYSLRCIEVKGRSVIHEDFVTVSKNEILTALNIPEQFILALVSVKGEASKVTYCMNSFESMPDSSACSINFNVQKLINNSNVVYEE